LSKQPGVWQVIKFDFLVRKLNLIYNFTLVSAIENVEVIAINRAIRDLARFTRSLGQGRWRKLMSNCQADVSDEPNCIGMKRTASEGVI